MNEEEVFIGGWTRERLAERSQTERHQVWKRARALHSAEGNHLARAIERLGLPYAEAEPLSDDDPLIKRMTAVFESPATRSAVIEATLDGLPAMAGVDPLLHDRLGEDYRLNPAAVPVGAGHGGEVDDRSRLCRGRPEGPAETVRRPDRCVLETRHGLTRDAVDIAVDAEHIRNDFWRGCSTAVQVARVGRQWNPRRTKALFGPCYSITTARITAIWTARSEGATCDFGSSSIFRRGGDACFQHG